MEEINLEWSKIYHIDSLENAPNSSGVYLLLLKNEDEFLPYYVGKSSNIRTRITTHISNFLGGLYDIYPIEDLKTFMKHKKDKSNLKYSPGKGVLYFINNYDTIKPHLFAFLKSLHFAFAGYQHKRDDITESSALHDLEKSTIKKIDFNKLSNVNCGEPYYFNVSHISLPH